MSANTLPTITLVAEIEVDVTELPTRLIEQLEHEHYLEETGLNLWL